jgi:DNA polymerase-1
MAHFSGDPRMLSIYREGVGDIYADMAQGIFGDAWTKDHRGICKTLVLAMGYGAGDKRVGSILTVNGYPTDTATGAEYVDELRGIYFVFFEYREQVIRKVKETGYVQTIGGRHRRLRAQFKDRRNWKNIAYGERQAVNAIIQGSAADVVRQTMIHTNADPLLKDFHLLAQVHDELIWEVDADVVTPDALRLIKWHGEEGHGYDLSVPLGFDPELGASWHEAKEGSPLGLVLPDDFENDSVTLDYEEER